MSPPRKRKIRLVTALSSAVILATALIYTSFTAASPAKTPSQLLSGARAGQSYELTGTVVNNSITRTGDTTNFRVADRAGTGVSVPVTYSGSVPSPFREGREIIVDVEKQGGGFVGQSGTLVTKCPSKFAAAKTGSTPY
ncbi:MAG TPA: cytochrome c maturation protein CcmE [Solirubrobacteraceae bacterium]|jgi:cytochrome c-type biogenesis protein CcmE|nr:cytochrome c maturation protein CcmE [Solirubrobacteraceae bacterium]